MFTELLPRSELLNPVFSLLRVGACVCCARCLAMDLRITVYCKSFNGVVLGRRGNYFYSSTFTRPRTEVKQTLPVTHLFNML
jgi:hypothetical protein